LVAGDSAHSTKYTYYFLAVFTALMRSNNFSRTSLFSADKFLLAASTASDFNITSASFNPFVKSVLPLLTRSQIASASPMPGAISTDPLIS
jgi:hypothetical protein